MRFRPSRRLLILAGLVLVLVPIGLLLLPEVVRRVAVTQLKARVDAPVRIEDVDFNLFTGRARVSDLVIGGADGKRPILQLARLDLHVSYRALLRGEPVFEYLRFNKPHLFIERTGSRRFNVFDVVRPEGGGALGGFTIGRLEVKRGEVTFVDGTQTPPVHQTLRSVQLSAGTLSTLPELTHKPTSFTLRLQLGAGSVTATGSATPLVRPASVAFTAHVRNLDPAIFETYLPSHVKVNLAGSWMNGQAQYVLAHHEGQISAHTLNTSVDVGPARVFPPGEKTAILTVAGFAAQDVRLDFLAGQGRVAELLVRQPHLLFQRDQAGRFNVAQLFPMDGSPQSGRERADLSIAFARARIDAGTVELVDRTTSPAVMTVLRDVQLTLADLNLALNGEPGRVEGKARLEGAPVHVTGTLRARPFATRLKLGVTNMPLQGFRGYIVTMLGAAEYLREGHMDGQLEIALATQQQGGLELEVSGAAEGRNLSLGLPGTLEPFLSAQRIAIDVTRLGIMPTPQADVARIELIGATMRVERDREGRFRLPRLWASSDDRGLVAPREPAPRSPRAGRFPVMIRRLEVEQSRLEFVDATVAPTFTSAISELGAEVRYPADHEDRASLKLWGALADSAPLELSGWVTPFQRPLQLHLKGTLGNYEVARLNPYAEKYIRYRVRRGRVSTNGAYEYKAGNLSAENEIRLRKIELGEEIGTEFQQRVGIPLKLALALLEDADGEIRLKIPVSGNLNNPEFSLGSATWKAIRNALLKVLTAPLRLLGKIVTLAGKIGEVRIDPIAFLPGSVEPDSEGRKRLAKLIEFLRDRPRVQLQLRGRTTSREVEALRRQRLREQLEATKGATYAEALAHLFRAAGGVESLKNPIPAEMKEQYVLERMVVAHQDLQTLAEDRARIIERTLVREGVEPKRLFVVSKDERAVTDTPPGRVEFELLY